jgi:hypothetical protein
VPLSEPLPALSPSVGSRVRGAPLREVRQEGIGPSFTAYQAIVLPLNYRRLVRAARFELAIFCSRNRRVPTTLRPDIVPPTRIERVPAELQSAAQTTYATGTHRPGWCPGIIVFSSVFREPGELPPFVDLPGIEPGSCG